MTTAAPKPAMPLGSKSPLRIHNSLTNSLTEFIPLDPDGRSVKWYGCGPTVYDASHMGHARTYVTFDIIRRIMTDYFGYSVHMCMNVTDIDDKIIARSYEQGINWKDLARKWENEFWRDMSKLNVRMPDVVTRVSEYIEENKAAIQKIISNNFAYEAEGSVYFDTKAFRSTDQHTYPRMEPNSFQDTARVLEGEGALGVARGRKDERDFALWKAAKPGEPSWESQWGPGRPGWHIECSAMSCAILGFPIDIHSGGIDLRFPHHDNEIAQCEAMYNKPHWVKYFLHTGHLNIYGAKMSKTEKNFITIKDALNEFTVSQLRLLFLMGRWDRPMNYSPGGETMKAAVDVDRIFSNFFSSIKAIVREENIQDVQSWTEEDNSLNLQLQKTEVEVHTWLCENFSTAECLLSLQRMVTFTNKYIMAGGSAAKSLLLRKVASYIFNILKVFGLYQDSEFSSEGGSTASSNIGDFVECIVEFRKEVRSVAHEVAGENKRLTTLTKRPASTEETLAELKGISDALQSKVETLLKYCDEVRDDKLVNLDIQVEDAEGKTIWKEKAKADILREREVRAKEIEAKKQKKEEAAKANLAAIARKEAELATPPSEYFQKWKGEDYDIQSLDELGIPVSNSKGEPLSKSQKDKAKKMLEKHKRAHESWLEEHKEDR